MTDLEPALSFCYAILGAATAEDAAAIWEGSPERRKAAHRALYERKPRAASYDAMMASMAALTPDKKEQEA